MFDLQNTVAVITGASQGNGYAIAQGFEQSGAIIINSTIRKIQWNKKTKR